MIKFTVGCPVSRVHFSDHIARLGEIKDTSKKGLFSQSLGQDTFFSEIYLTGGGWVSLTP